MKALQEKLAQNETSTALHTAKARPQYSYMDVKEASEYTERFRAEAMMLVWKLKHRRKAALKNPVLSMMHKKEMGFLERQTTEAVALYRDAKRLYHGLYETYLGQITPMSYAAGLYERIAA